MSYCIAKTEEVIITDLQLRGDGKNIPYRRIVQVYSKDGTLIAERDPCLIDVVLKAAKNGDMETVEGMLRGTL